MEPRAVILVEGASDRVAVETLASRLERDLDADGVEIVTLGGATNVGRFLAHDWPRRGRPLLAGLYDEAEERFFARALQRAGPGPVVGRSGLEETGFFACVADLEDELIRAVGEPGMIDVIDAAGELASFHLLQRQPAQRHWTRHQQLRRFLSARSGNKSRYARLLVEALDLQRTPLPLAAVLERV